MRRPGVRITVRRMMVAVAAVGLALGGWRQGSAWLERRDDYAIRAEAFAWVEEQDRGFLRDAPHVLARLTESAADRRHRTWLEWQMRHVEARAPFLRAMVLKYERAARYPWVTIGPDPIEPGTTPFFDPMDQASP
ncbi:hypothetical protein TA3x_005655 [Tundrisphaera sp. TA3]|uniref:hypothetical protein n=1 Tax=Tundrisphaera sp. TA3 TaxID=3435775 RepID=UPI003EBE5EA2